MARRGTIRLWLVLALVAAGIGLAAGAGGGRPETRPATSHATGAALTERPVEAAVVPARTEAGFGTGVERAPGRSLLPLVAALVALAGGVGLTARRSSAPPVAGHQPLWARRHSVALRAPPAFQLV